MDYIVEIITLGIDVLILGTCVKQYYKNKKFMTMIEGAPYLAIDKQLKDIVQTHPDKKLAYVSIRGIVQPLGNPIVSIKNPEISGVVQLLSIKEHVVQRSTAGAWSEHERIIQEVHNVMPFVLENNGYKVEVVDPLAAEVLDLDVISDIFKPSKLSLADHIWGFFYGARQRGIQETEKMLRKGTMITGVGELVTSTDSNTVRLQPPANGAPFYLTNMQISALIRKLDDWRKKCLLLGILCGTIGVIISGLIVRKYWRERRRKVEEEERRIQIAISRKERREKFKNEDIPENQLCVVCKSNPREVSSEQHNYIYFSLEMTIF